MKTKVFAAAALLLLPAAARAETTLVNPDWEFYDDFESPFEEGFWASSGAGTTYGAACPGSDAFGNTLVFDYHPDDPEPGHGWAERRFTLPIDAVQLEISYKLFVPANYVHTSGNHKNFVLWSGDYGKVNANISVSSESWPAEGGASPSVYIGVDGANYGHAMNESTMPLLLEDGLGDWIDIHIFLDLAREEGDFGVFEIFKDGQRITGNLDEEVVSYADVPLHEQISFAERGNFIDQGYLLGWANGGFAEETTFCVADFRIRANSVHGDFGNAADLECTHDADCPGDASCESSPLAGSEHVTTRCSTETGTPDTGSPDAGSPDVGTPDAGSPDVGAPDVSSPDTGEGNDAGDNDAGASPSNDGHAGGCASVPAGHPGGSLAALLLMMLGVIRMRRKR
ncbi:hypothetical protein EA187_17450 [Lujinxingia sediminis]|uniref:Uncharacterized protein n=1 Tax=Lujinxingia sediminis TaxID=2480984 RepID=A0ABY0CP09_9DELT|nr:MYXO-CTERM sorting domain-containing protein [Lujinxingia sediminis]RVU42123.1 hypothetical protein EA187_17450 [Lujinxingia sediminis]